MEDFLLFHSYLISISCQHFLLHSLRRHCTPLLWQLFHTRRCWFVIILVRKMLRFYEVSFKMLFVRANTIIIINIVFLYVLGTPSCEAPNSNECAQWHTKGYSILVIWDITGFSYKKPTLLIISTVKQKGCSCENLCFQIRQGHTGGIISGTKSEIPAGFSVTKQLARFSL